MKRFCPILNEYISNFNQKRTFSQITFFETTYAYKNCRKKNWGEKIFLDPPLRENSRQKRKNAKNETFQAKKGQNMTEKMIYSNFS